jgi:carboxyl-terminal processing protease
LVWSIFLQNFQRFFGKKVCLFLFLSNFLSANSYSTPHLLFSDAKQFALEKKSLLTSGKNKKISIDATNDEDETQKHINTLLEIIGILKREYVEPLTQQKLFEGAFNGMLSSLDPHSMYCKEEDFEAMCERIKGEFGGLGMELAYENAIIKVIAPIDGTPAFKAGIKRQDIILAVDNSPLAGVSFIEAVKKMRGKPGTSVTLLIKREGEKPFSVEMKRSLIQFPSVKAKIESENVGYIRISTFDEKAAESLATAVKEIQKKLGADLKGFVLDLRDNPGGLLDQAISACSLFIDDGVVVSTRGQSKESETVFKSDPGKVIVQGVPIVILINEGSASASEIMAGALQEHKVALVIGENSFGKGSVQTLRGLEKPLKGGLKFTVALFFTPNGNVIQGKGIKPDIEVPQLKGLSIEKPLFRFSEKNLPRTLGASDSTKEPSSPKKEEKKSEEDKGMIFLQKSSENTVVIDPEKLSGNMEKDEEIKDYQLMRAVEIIQALSTWSKNKPEK